MKEKIAFIRLAIVFLLIAFVGKLVMSWTGRPYEEGNRLFGMLPLAIHLCLAWGAFARRYKNYGIAGGLMVGALIGLSAYILIWLGTAGSYLAGVETHFNYPASTPFGTAIMGRSGGLLFGAIVGGIASAIGWSLGGLIPARDAA